MVFYFTVEQSFFLLLMQALYNVSIAKKFIWIRIRIEKAAGSRSALKKRWIHIMNADPQPCSVLPGKLKHWKTYFRIIFVLAEKQQREHFCFFPSFLFIKYLWYLQEPVLFSSSLRFNLDPAGRHTDDQLRRVLELASLPELAAAPGALDQVRLDWQIEQVYQYS